MSHQKSLVLNWIGGQFCPPGQAPLNLGPQINSFETDFSNGFLLGKILTQYGLCNSISSFSNKTSKEAKVQNFYQIEEALRSLKVSFDAKLIHGVMNEEPGASMKLLHLMRNAFEHKFSQTDKTVTGLKTSVVDAKVKKVSELAVTLPKIHKEYGVDGPTFKAKKLQQIEEKLLKYEVARANLENKAHQDDLAERNMLQSIQQQKRQDAIQKMKENKEFMTDWENTGKLNWKKNREVRANEIARQLYFDDREVKIYKSMLDKELNLNSNEMKNGILEFHENLRKLGVEENITIKEAIERQEQKKGIPPGQIQNFSYAATMNKIKETKNNNEFAGKERERRNRKMNVDQRKIQESLDASKTEELLIVKLLAKQTEEQNMAFKKWRIQKCHEITFNNMVNKAHSIHQQKLEKTEVLERTMKEQAQALQPEREIQHAKNKNEIKDIRKQEKAFQRRINIEIASEIVDLLMDVAEEAADYEEKHKHIQDEDDKLLKKEMWRQWMAIFKDGKKVSEQNIVINKEEDKGVVKQQDPIARLLGDKLTPSQIIERIKHESVYSDFLQYLCMCGPLNLKQTALDKWNSLIQLVQTDSSLKEKKFDLDFLNVNNLPNNSELFQVVENLYLNFNGDLLQKQTTGGTSMSNAMSFIKQSDAKIEATLIQEEETKSSQIPNWHTLKLCLIGGKFAGKKTVAQSLAEEFGLTVFNMDDVVREALNYVQPEKKEEVVDPKAKAKGKPAQEAAPVELFQGLNTTVYKEIATAILKQIQVNSGQDKIPSKDVDLMSLVADDSLLVSLFIEKLKLTYHNPPPSEEQLEAKMKENLDKQKELLEQLREAQETEANNANINQAPAKGAKNAKNVVKSSKDIQDEIDALMSIEKNGWILVDFPRNINQAKLMENSLSGYKSLSDKPKTNMQINQEILAKFADPVFFQTDSYSFEAQPSFFDGIFMLDTHKDECTRRVRSRKVDNTNGTVYHMEDNPPPANDVKLQERLQHYYGIYPSENDMLSKLDQSHLNFAEQQSYFASFFQEFGNLDEHTGKGLETFQMVQIEKKKDKTEIYSHFQQNVKKILRFKQIYKDREYEMLRQKIKIQIQNQKLEDELKAASKVEIMDATPQANQSNLQVIDFLEATDKGKTFNSKFSDIQSESLSKNTLNQRRMKAAKTQYTTEQKVVLWEQMVASYLKNGMLTMNQINKQSEALTTSLNYCQSDFIQYLERADSKQDIVNEFVKSFNQLTSEFPDLRNDDQTKEELLVRVEQLSSKLWLKVLEKKDQNLEEIAKQAETGWSDQQMKLVCKNIASLIEIEINKFNTVFQIMCETEPPVELDAEILVKKMLERGAQPFDSKTRISPILQNVVKSLLTKLEDLFIQSNSDSTKNISSPVLENEKQIFIYRLTCINAWGLAMLEEISFYSQEVYQLMDDWIVEAVAIENHNMMQVVKSIASFIKSELQVMNEDDFIIQPTSLFNKVQPKTYEGGTPMYLQNVVIKNKEVEDTRFEIGHLQRLYLEIRGIIGDFGSYDFIEQQAFTNLMMLAIRQGRIPNCWRYLDFEKIKNICYNFQSQPLPKLQIGNLDMPTQYQSQAASHTRFQETNSQWVSWKQLLTYFVLLSSRLPTAQQVEDYSQRLLAKSADKCFVTMQEFIKVSAWFDHNEGKADSKLSAKWLIEEQRKSHMSEYEDAGTPEDNVQSKLDVERIAEVKKLLFEIHRVKLGEEKLNIEAFVNMLQTMVDENGSTFSEKLMQN